MPLRSFPPTCASSCACTSKSRVPPSDGRASSTTPILISRTKSTTACAVKLAGIACSDGNRRAQGRAIRQRNFRHVGGLPQRRAGRGAGNRASLAGGRDHSDAGGRPQLRGDREGARAAGGDGGQHGGGPGGKRAAGLPRGVGGRREPPADRGSGAAAGFAMAEAAAGGSAGGDHFRTNPAGGGLRAEFAGSAAQINISSDRKSVV